MSANLVAVPVPGADVPLQAAEIDGRPFVALRPLCDSLGINYTTQFAKLRSRSWATVAVRGTVAADGRRRDMSLIDRRTFAMWLATINENKVDERARPLIVAYQREAAAALDAYFNEPKRPTTIDGIRAMLDQIEAAQRDAHEAKAIAAKTDARLDAIEGKHGWFAALGWARLAGLSDTSNSAMRKLGCRAAAIARANGIAPNKVQHHLYGDVNQLPAWVWETAVDQLGLVKVAAE
jgi:hypothetical protein